MARKAKAIEAPAFEVPAHWPVKEPARYRRLDELRDCPTNPRTHPEHEIDVLSRLIAKFGPDQDIVVDERFEILKGHGRKRAALKAGLTHFTCTQRFGLSEADKKALRIADNQVAVLADWDRVLIREEMRALEALGYDMQLLAFDGPSLGWLTAGEVVIDPAGEWGGMPHFSNPDAKAFRSIVVHFEDQAAVDLFTKRVGIEVTEKMKFMHFPQANIKPFVKYSGEGSREKTAAAE
jgi:hypothetical protein